MKIAPVIQHWVNGNRRLSQWMQRSVRPDFDRRDRRMWQRCEPCLGYEVPRTVKVRAGIWHRDHHIGTQHREPRLQITERADWSEFHRQEDGPSDIRAA